MRRKQKGNKRNVRWNTLTYPGNESRLKEADNLQRDLKADWYQVVIEDHKRQEVEYKVTSLQVYTRNIIVVNSYQ